MAVIDGGPVMCVLLVQLRVIQRALVALVASEAPQDARLSPRPGWAAVAAPPTCSSSPRSPGSSCAPASTLAPKSAGFCAAFSVPVLGAFHYFAHDRAVQADEAAGGHDGRPNSDDARG
ncbi:hypothetical protein ACF09H_32050 [Streptomyces sp. NPDC014983]|uniref:hypothetical protein n=1 Tax=Streptomyces sp. NPDC014983 TaxID=3364933 RepID=UPI0036FF1F07